MNINLLIRAQHEERKKRYYSTARTTNDEHNNLSDAGKASDSSLEAWKVPTSQGKSHKSNSKSDESYHPIRKALCVESNGCCARAYHIGRNPGIPRAEPTNATNGTAYLFPQLWSSCVHAVLGLGVQ